MMATTMHESAPGRFSELVAVIPAYNPPTTLLDIANNLSQAGFKQVVVLNDGSTAAYTDVFELLRSNSDVTVLRHAVNLGKGAALKTAFNCVLCDYPESVGVITLDADGQHLFDDIINAASTFLRYPDSLVLGSRTFERATTPFRNRIGNKAIRQLFFWLTGCWLNDTQSGLRVMPTRLLADLIKLQANGYEFETQMLLHALKRRVPIMELPIQTVYKLDQGASHFKPIIDSLKVCLTLLKRRA